MPSLKGIYRLGVISIGFVKYPEDNPIKLNMQVEDLNFLMEVHFSCLHQKENWYERDQN